jgi:hypothetical protein
VKPTNQPGRIGTKRGYMKDEPRSLKYAKGRTIGDVKNLLSSLLSDVIVGSVTPKTANAVAKKAMDYAMGRRPKELDDRLEARLKK